MRIGSVKLLGLSSLCVLVASCATVEQRVENGLTEAGVPAGMASCMATIWEDELSVKQIRKIGSFASEVREEQQPLTVSRLVSYVREWDDPQALGVVTSSAARCAVR